MRLWCTRMRARRQFRTQKVPILLESASSLPFSQWHCPKLLLRLARWLWCNVVCNPSATETIPWESRFSLCPSTTSSLLRCWEAIVRAMIPCAWLGALFSSCKPRSNKAGARSGSTCFLFEFFPFLFFFLFAFPFSYFFKKCEIL